MKDNTIRDRNIVDNILDGESLKRVATRNSISTSAAREAVFRELAILVRFSPCVSKDMVCTITKAKVHREVITQELYKLRMGIFHDELLNRKRELTPLIKLNLPTDVKHALIAADLLTIEDVLKLGSKEDLQNIRGIGQAKIQKLIDFLDKHNFKHSFCK